MIAKREVTAVYVDYRQGHLRREFDRPGDAHEYAAHFQAARILRELVMESEDQS